jgi:stage II sporulation protein D
VDYLEVRPAQNGASADRFSTLSNWTVQLSLAEVASRLSRYVKVPGTLTDIRVIERGASRRVTELEIIATGGVSRIKGGRIRSALGLKEQLFVVDRQFDSQGRVSGIMLSGRGFGHGVGMCQVGSFGLAKAGYTFKQILEHYYTGIELSNIYQ